MRTLDGTENTEGREEGDGGRGEERKRVRLDERASTLRGREREGKLELLWDTGVGGGVGRLTG